MDDSPLILSGEERSYDDKFSFIVLLSLVLLTGTFLRVSLVAIYPLVALFIAAFYRFRISAPVILLISLAFLSCVFSFYDGWFLKYKLLSLFYMLPLIVLLFSQPSWVNNKRNSLLSVFIKCLTVVALVNDITGLMQLFINPGSDDSFQGIYSQFSISSNGLVLLNTMLFYFYLAQYIYKKGMVNLIGAGVFLSSAILGFYGAGLIICTLALILSFFRFQLKSLLKTITIGFFSLVMIYLLLLLIKPGTLEYNMVNIKKLVSFDITNGPRKLKSFYNYGISYPTNAKDFLFGSGPGTFNSRTAFMVGSPYYFENIKFIKDDKKPYYFKNFAYPLWNETNTSQALYLDGFRNQPFSSMLAFLGEYGFIFTVTFLLLYYAYYRKVAVLYKSNRHDSQANVCFRFFKFLIILLPLLLVIDNYYESPEVMLLILTGIKFSHEGLLRINKSAYPAQAISTLSFID